MFDVTGLSPKIKEALHYQYHPYEAMHSRLRSDLERIFKSVPADKQSHHDYNASEES